MFDQLVLSSRQRRRHTTGKFFVFTASVYALAIAGAFVVSILASDPKLADTSRFLDIIPLRLSQPVRVPGSYVPNVVSDHGRIDPNNVVDYDHLTRHTSPVPMPIPNFDRFADDFGYGTPTGPPGVGSIYGVPHGADTGDAPPPKPDPPRPRPVAQSTPPDTRPMPVISQVLQGKAIERPKPAYPPLAQQIRLQGDVSVEVIISLDGHVESARSVGGHPMLAAAAVEAARRWRFQPTTLNNVPVRVTGVIVFVFKLTE